MRRLLAHDRFGSLLRVGLWLAITIRAQRSLARVRQALAYPEVGLPLARLRETKTRPEALFIIGSSSSINDLTLEQYSTMRVNTSIGINIWVAHPFVPDFYSLEGGSFPPSQDEQAHRSYLTNVLCTREADPKEPAVIQLMPKPPHHPSQVVAVPETMRTRSSLVCRVNLPRAQSVEGLRRDLASILALLHKRLVPRGVLPDSGASVIRLIFYGFQMGFTDIVLVGVDLNENRYFWDEGDFAELRRLFPRAKGAPHDTLETHNRPYSAKAFILTLAEVLERNHGVKLWAGSGRSSLARQIGVFDWGAHACP